MRGRRRTRSLSPTPAFTSTHFPKGPGFTGKTFLLTPLHSAMTSDSDDVSTHGRYTGQGCTKEPVAMEVGLPHDRPTSSDGSEEVALKNPQLRRKKRRW